MSKLTTMQIDVLASACARDNGLAIRPTTFKAAAAAKIAAKLIELGLVRTLRAKLEMPVWRVDEDGEAISLKVLKAGRLALAATMPAGEPRASEGEDPASGDDRAARSAIKHAAVGKTRSKRASVIALLSRDWGATLDELVTATDWLPHTTRAALTGLRKSGLSIERSRDEGGASVYRIPSSPEAAAA